MSALGTVAWKWSGWRRTELVEGLESEHRRGLCLSLWSGTVLQLLWMPSHPPLKGAAVSTCRTWCG